MLTLLPERPVQLAAAALFAIGAVVLFVGARKADADEADDERRVRAAGSADSRTGWRAAGASFLVLFAAEWGDLSQLLTAGLVAAGRPAGPGLRRLLGRRWPRSPAPACCWAGCCCGGSGSPWSAISAAAVCAILAVVTVVTAVIDLSVRHVRTAATGR